MASTDFPDYHLEWHVGDMFQWKIGDISKDLPNMFGIVDHILVVVYDANGIDHDKTSNE